MKKTILGIVLLLSVGATQVNAQSISGGIKAEANLSNFILSDLPGVKNDMGFGATLGGFAKFDIVKNFAIQPELLFHFQTSTTEILNIENDYEYWGMEIPVYAMGQWYTNPGDRFYVAVGPYVGLGFSSKYTDLDVDLYDTERHQRWDFGAKATLGYEFRFGLQINAAYKIGFINAIDEGVGTMLPQMVSLGLGYRF